MKFYGGGRKKNARYKENQKAGEPMEREEEQSSGWQQEPDEAPVSPEAGENTGPEESGRPAEPAEPEVAAALTPRQEKLRRRQEKKLAKQEKKAAKKQRTPAQKRRKRLLVLVILLAIVAAGAAVWQYYVKPPETGGKDGETSVSGDALTIQGENRKEDYFTFFIGATDEDGTRTDSMMLVSMNIQDGEINVLNIPRDTMSDVSRANKKINGAYNKGIEGTRKEIKQLLGIDFDKYIVFSFDAIAEFVDIIGGIDYDVPFYMYYDDPSQDLHIHFKKGMQHLDGEEVVEFLRWRKNNDGTVGTGMDGGDIDRIEKQQEFLKTLAAEFMTPANIVKIPEMAQCIQENVESDITKGQLVWLGIQAIKIGASHINMYVLPGEARYINEVSYYVGFEDKTLEMLNAYFNPYTYELTEDDVDIISPSSTGKLTSPTRDNDDLGAITGEDTRGEVTTSRKNDSTSSGKTNSRDDDEDDDDDGDDDEDDENGSGGDSHSGSGSSSGSGSGSGGSSDSDSGDSGSGTSGGKTEDPETTGGSSSGSGSGEENSGSSGTQETPVDPEL